MGKWGVYYFAVACLVWSVCMTAFYVQTLIRLETYQKPHKAEYSLMRDMDLYFGLTGTYTEMELFVKQTTSRGDWDFPRVFKYCMKMKSYIDEMKRREVGEMSATPVDRNRLIAENEDYQIRHTYYGH